MESRSLSIDVINLYQNHYILVCFSVHNLYFNSNELTLCFPIIFSNDFLIVPLTGGLFLWYVMTANLVFCSLLFVSNNFFSDNKGPLFSLSLLNYSTSSVETVNIVNLFYFQPLFNTTIKTILY